MWSDRYYYLNICFDLELSRSIETDKLREFLDALPEFIQSDPFGFKNSDSFAFTTIALLNARSISSWSDKDVDAKATNLVSIVTAKSEEEQFYKSLPLFIKIADFLEWQLIDEETDDGVENFVLHKPENGPQHLL